MTSAGQIRSMRIQNLVKMARRGATKSEIINHVLSWGVSMRTAKEYHQSVLAILKSRYST